MTTKEANCSKHDEPIVEGDDWVSWGGEQIWATGFTEGGAPFGMTAEEFRQMNEESEPRAGWALAKEVLRQALKLQNRKEADEAIGWVRFLGEGLYYRAYYSDCQVRRGSSVEEMRLVVRLPKADAPKDSTPLARHEVEVLNYLQSLNLPIRVPRLIAAITTSHGIALVQQMLYGFPLEMRAPRNSFCKPWEAIAQAAAACHQIDPGPLNRSLPHFLTCRDHAMDALRVFDELAIPEAPAALAWARSNLPAEQPTRLLHGDLLGQNILIDPDTNVLGLIDWSNAVIGDPAWDFAIVTRGVRQPFQVQGGLQKLLKAYGDRTGVTVSPSNIHFYEMCLMAGFYKQDLKAYGEGSPRAETTRTCLANFLKRVGNAHE